MILDGQLQLDDGTTNVTGAANATQVSPNVIDFGVARNIGVGTDLYWIAAVVAALVGAGSSVQVDIQTSPDNATWTTRQRLGTFAPVAAIGSVLKKKVQVDELNDRYARAIYTVLGATLTSAKVAISMTPSIDASTPYPNNTTIVG